jgi:hypothetical protein
MTEERWKTWMSLAQFIIGTVIVGIFGTIINSQIQTREVEIKEQEQISKNLATVLSPNVADKQSMAHFYAAVTRSDAIRKRWEIYRDELDKEIAEAKAQREKAASEIKPGTDAKVIDQKQAIIQRIDERINPSATAPTLQELPARVFFHIQNESQRERAASLAGEFAKETAALVQGVQRVDESPNINELRYFKLSDAIDAEKYAKALAKLGLNVNPKYTPGWESPDKLRPKHFEVWISAPWN